MKNNLNDVFKAKVCNKDRVKDNVLRNTRKESIYMKKWITYIVGGLGVVIIAMVIGFNGNNKTVLEVDYVKYLSENKKLVLEKNELRNEIQDLYQQFINNKINETEYFTKLEELRNKTFDVDKKMDSLKEEYKIKEEVNLDEVKFSSDKTKNNKIKELYKKEIELEKREEELDRKEDELERKYREGKITKAEFIKQMKKLEDEEDALDKEEDELEKEEDKLGVDVDDLYEDDDKQTTTKPNTSYIDKEKAKSIALKNAGISANKVRELEVELDREDNKYEVEFKYNGKEYSYEIHAKTGKILDKEIEIDD